MSSESSDDADPGRGRPAVSEHAGAAELGGATTRSHSPSQSDSQFGSDSQEHPNGMSPDPELDHARAHSSQLSSPLPVSPAAAYASDEDRFGGPNEGRFAEDDDRDRGRNEQDEQPDTQGERNERYERDERDEQNNEDEPTNGNERDEREADGAVGDVNMDEPLTKEVEPGDQEPDAVCAPSPAENIPLGGEMEWPPPGRPKRQRRRPQRWEGAPPAAPTRPSRRLSSGSGGGPNSSAPTAPAGGVLALLHPAVRRGIRGSFGSGGGGFEIDDGTTASAHTDELPSPVPEAIDPLDSMHEAMDRARELAPRGHMVVVDEFNEWQLKTISAESNHQKSLHSYLRRKLRKRASRVNERERKEEDALRNACSAPPAPTDEWSTPPDGAKSSVDARAGTKRVRTRQGLDASGADLAEREEAWIRQYEEDIVVPSKVRLPLESYIPRRVRRSDTRLSVDEFLHQLPVPPTEPGSFRTWQDPSQSTEKSKDGDFMKDDSKAGDDDDNQ